MTETTITEPTPTTVPWTRWLYPALAITGIAVGIFIVVGGAYLIFFPHSGAMHAPKDDCCTSMKDHMKDHMKDMKPKEQMPSMPSMSSMPSMPPTPVPTPGR